MVFGNVIKRVYIVGGNGFIGQNLTHTLRFNSKIDVVQISRSQILNGETITLTSDSALYLLGGVSRAQDENEFFRGNVEILRMAVSQIKANGHKLTIFHASSVRAAELTPYGRSKLVAEEVLFELGNRLGFIILNLRIPNVFGKWSRPNHNSVVATFCSKIADSQDLIIHNPDSVIDFVYIDSLVSELTRLAFIEIGPSQTLTLNPEFTCSVLELASRLQKLSQMRTAEVFPKLLDDFDKRLYSTLITYFPISKAIGKYNRFIDHRGSFAELSRDQTIGQLSIATCLKNQQRGNHVHHSKVERFLPLHGNLKIELSNIRTFESLEIEVSPGMWVETIPGWIHTVSSPSLSEFSFLIWANENFEPDKSDTYVVPANGES